MHHNMFIQSLQRRTSSVGLLKNSTEMCCRLAINIYRYFENVCVPRTNNYFCVCVCVAML